MGSFAIGHYALGIGAAAALLAGCGAPQLPMSVPGATPAGASAPAKRTTSNYKVLYSFGPFPDAENPRASLIDVSGKFYGTTARGGSYSFSCRYYDGNDCGTVFSIAPSGAEKVLHSFGFGSDGSTPLAPLIAVKGTLYGTTFEGGTNRGCSYDYNGCGTVFSVTRSGTEKVLVSFGAGEPEAPLVDVNGTLYGTTYTGGANDCSERYPSEGCGTVFKVTTGGAESTLHSFGLKGDGFGPRAGMIDVGATFYGTTYDGGAHRRSGTVFSITPSGTEKVLHNFGYGTDGAHPVASLIDVAGTLYGTTERGGAYGLGAVFSITRSGKEKLLHSFGDGTDGAIPAASLTDVNGTLYGTTSAGGAYSQGTIFSIATSGTEEVLYSFSGADGETPEASLIDVKSTLYGTTEWGGAHGYGTVFALTL